VRQELNNEWNGRAWEMERLDCRVAIVTGGRHWPDTICMLMAKGARLMISDWKRAACGQRSIRQPSRSGVVEYAIDEAVDS
jgi:hypothetical protein